MKRTFSLAYQVFFGIGVGILIGTLSTFFHWVFVIRLFQTLNLMFTDFLQWLIPLFIISYMVPTVSKISNSGSRLLLKVFLHTVIFCYLGMFLSFIIGYWMLPTLLKTVSSHALGSEDVRAFFRLPLTPLLNISQALSLAVLLILFGRFSSSSSLIKVLIDIQEWIKTIFEKFILPLIPIYILSVFVKISSQESSVSILVTLLPIIGVTVISCFAIFLLYNAILLLFGIKLSPFGFFRTYKAPLGFALASQSSSATLPITLATCYKNGMDAETTEFVIPLATSINATGGSICVLTSVMSVAIMNGFAITWKSLLVFMLNVPPSIFSSAGIPGGSSFIIAPLLTNSLGFNSASVGFTQALILIQDPFATMTNVMSCIIIALFFSRRPQTISFSETKES